MDIATTVLYSQKYGHLQKEQQFINSQMEIG